MKRSPLRPSIGAPKRIEKHRWLRSDGTPNFEDRIYKSTEELEIIAKKPVVEVAPSTPVMDAIEEMSSRNIRSLIVALSGKIKGLLLATHIVNYLGGGEYYKIVGERHSYNIYSALRREPIDTIMEKDPIIAYIDEKLVSVLEKMVLNEIGIIPVVLRDGRVYGVITEHDLIRHLSTVYSIGARVSEVMTSPVISIRSGSSIKEAMEHMIKYGFRRLPVVRDNIVAGIITVMDIIKYFGTHRAFQYTVSGDIREATKIPVDEIMVREPVTVKADDDLSEAAKIMYVKNIGSVLVVNDNMELIGIVTERDILYALVAKKTR